MRDKVPQRYSTIVLSGEIAGLLSSAEAELVRADALISAEPLANAIRQQILRIDALASTSIDGKKVSLSDLIKLEATILNVPFSDDDCSYLYQLANRIDLEDARSTIVAFRYMRTVDWVSKNIRQDEEIDESIFETIHALYNESEIEKLSEPLEERKTTSLQKQNHGKPQLMRKSQARDTLVADYLSLLNSNAFTPASQAELSHAQLQMLKPYEGNLDAYERVFSHIVFYKRGILTESVAPLALGPARNIERHVRSLVSNMRSISAHQRSPADADFRHSAYCTKIAARISIICCNLISHYWSVWKEQLGATRSDSASLALAKLLLEIPCTTIAYASMRINRSFSSTNNAMKELIGAGIVQEIGCISKRRLFCATGYIGAFQLIMEKAASSEALNRDELLKELRSAARA